MGGGGDREKQHYGEKTFAEMLGGGGVKGEKIICLPFSICYSHVSFMSLPKWA